MLESYILQLVRQQLELQKDSLRNEEAHAYHKTHRATLTGKRAAIQRMDNFVRQLEERCTYNVEAASSDIREAMQAAGIEYELVVAKSGSHYIYLQPHRINFVRVADHPQRFKKGRVRATVDVIPTYTGKLPGIIAKVQSRLEQEKLVEPGEIVHRNFINPEGIQVSVDQVWRELSGRQRKLKVVECTFNLKQHKIVLFQECTPQGVILDSRKRPTRIQLRRLRKGPQGFLLYKQSPPRGS